MIPGTKVIVFPGSVHTYNAVVSDETPPANLGDCIRVTRTSRGKYKGWTFNVDRSEVVEA